VSDNPYLKRVVSVNKNQDKIEVKTEDTTISDVINTGRVSSKTVLFNTQNDVDSSALKRMVRYKTDYKKETTQIWKSGRFSVTDIKNLNSKNSKYLQKSNISNNYYEITIADNDIVVNAEKTLQVDIKAKMKDEGIKEGYKFKSMKLISLEHPNKSSSNDFGAWYSTTKLQNSQIEGYLKWTPKRNSVSTGKVYSYI